MKRNEKYKDMSKEISRPYIKMKTVILRILSLTTVLFHSLGSRA